MRPPRSGGGWTAIGYALRTARRAGGLWRFFRALRARNACKTCALGMGGQRGGMVNEAGHFPEVCKKSMQAMAADMQGRITPEFFARYSFAELQQFSPRELEHMGRLNDPVYAGPNDDRFRIVSWGEALQHCVERLKVTPPDQNFFYFSGRASNEAAFCWQLFARLLGTNNVNNCSYYCHQASGVALRAALGSGTATVVLDDLAHCDLVFLIGANPASNHPRLMTALADLRRRGGQIVVINPLEEVGLVNFRIPSRPTSLLFGSPIASLYLQPHAGGDHAVLAGIAKVLLDRAGGGDADAVASAFIASHTTGFAESASQVRALDWAEIERLGGVPRAALEQAADLYQRSRATIFAWTMGITHHVHGTDNVRAIVNLALLRGMVGRPRAGLLPIRGHSNVQGVGSVGVLPKLTRPTLERLEARLGVKLPTTAGLDTLACVEAMAAGRLRNAWCLGGNLFGASPDATATAAAFAKVDSLVYVSTTLNTGHAWGRGRHTLILPVRARDEEAQATTQESMFNYVRLSDGGPARLPNARSEVDIVLHLAREVLGDDGPVCWSDLRDHRRIRELIAAVVPGYEPLAQIDATKREFQIAGRTFHTPTFTTADGKAHFDVAPLPANEPPAGALRLITLRSEGQFNTVVYEDEDVYRGQERRDVILMNERDMARLGLRADQRVRVRSETGVMQPVLVRAFSIREGNAAMYYPEANVLVPATADSKSRTPAFKNVPVWVEPLPSGVVRTAADHAALVVAAQRD